ncbi:MAG: hypothetical protein JJU02_15355 [Cryomorphaceae bacterium]|nr:hypothetical protein [Cryomorphaceae bacterium]
MKNVTRDLEVQTYERRENISALCNVAFHPTFARIKKEYYHVKRNFQTPTHR